VVSAFIVIAQLFVLEHEAAPPQVAKEMPPEDEGAVSMTVVPAV
jgi:hypothetical protein